MRSPGMKRSRGVKRCAPTKSRVDEPNGNIYADLHNFVSIQRKTVWTRLLQKYTV